jgi:hypothetical protein
MVAVRDRSLPERKPSFLPSLVAVAVPVLLVLVALPAQANHVQTVTVSGATYTVEFDHAGDNEWWVEFEARATNGDSIFIGWAQVEGESGTHYMQFAANSYERQQQGWSKFEPDQAFHVTPGKRVRFSVGMTDGATGQAVNNVDSCWFTHPAGVEQCGDIVTDPIFDAPFTGFRGNEWWVQAKVGTNGPTIAKVDVRIAPSGAWQPLAKQNWGTSPPSWAGSYHFPQGSILQMRATASDGRTDLSSCRQWIPPANTDATLVSCPGSSTTTTTPPPPPTFDATFSNVKGNSYWAEAVVTANMPVHMVSLRIDCSADWHQMQYRSDWGKWVIGKAIPTGAKVTLVAQHNDGAGNSVFDHSGGYVWPNASPTTGC